METLTEVVIILIVTVGIYQIFARLFETKYFSYETERNQIDDTLSELDELYDELFDEDTNENEMESIKRKINMREELLREFLKQKQ